MQTQTQTYLDEKAQSRLIWRSRRGMLENDLFIERFFKSQKQITHTQEMGMLRLMDLSDNDLMDLFLNRKTLQSLIAETAHLQDLDAGQIKAMQNVLEQIKNAPHI